MNNSIEQMGKNPDMPFSLSSKTSEIALPSIPLT